MKRLISMVLVLLVMALALTGCGANPVGTYVTRSVNGQPVADYIESVGATTDMLEINAAEELMTLDVRADGTFSVKQSGSDLNTGTWKQEGGKLNMTIDGVTESFTLNGDELTYRMEEIEIVFAKQV